MVPPATASSSYRGWKATCHDSVGAISKAVLVARSLRDMTRKVLSRADVAAASRMCQYFHSVIVLFTLTWRYLDEVTTLGCVQAVATSEA